MLNNILLRYRRKRLPKNVHNGYISCMLVLMRRKIEMKFTSNAALMHVLSTLNIESITFWLTVDQDFE